MEKGEQNYQLAVHIKRTNKHSSLINRLCQNSCKINRLSKSSIKVMKRLVADGLHFAHRKLHDLRC